MSEVIGRAWRPRIVSALVALLTVGLLAAACGGGATGTAGSPGAASKTAKATHTISVSGAPHAARNEVVVEQGVGANTLDPDFTNSTPEGNILINMMQGLLTRNAKEKVVPELATSYKNVNPTTWEFKLRKGVKFQDGETFNGQSVKYSFDRVADPKIKSPNGTDKEIAFKAVKILSPYDVEIITSKPEPLLPQYVANFYMLPPKYYGSHSLSYLSTHPVGSGPFKFVSWVKNEAVTETRWSGYWGTPARLKTVVFKPEAEAATQMDALRTGAADITTVLSPDQVKQVNAFPNAHVEPFQSGRDIFVGINYRRPYMKDPRVRQALNYAVNWSAIKSSLLDGFGSRMASVVVPGAVNRDTSLKPYPYDPARAKKLLAAANFPMSHKMIMDTPVGRYTDDEQIAQVVGSDLKAVGLHVTVKPIPWSVYAGSMLMQGKENSLFLIGLGSSYTAQQDLLWVAPSFWLQMTNWNDAKFNTAYNALTTTFSPSKRKQLADAAQEAVYNDPPWIFLWQQYEFYGVNKHLNYTPRSDETIPLWDVSWNTK